MQLLQQKNAGIVSQEVTSHIFEQLLDKIIISRFNTSRFVPNPGILIIVMVIEVY